MRCRKFLGFYYKQTRNSVHYTRYSSKVTKRDLMVASTRQHRACLLKYYPGLTCTPSFVKSRTIRPVQTHFLLFQQQCFFVLVFIHPGNPRIHDLYVVFGNILENFEISLVVLLQNTTTGHAITYTNSSFCSFLGDNTYPPIILKLQTVTNWKTFEAHSPRGRLPGYDNISMRVTGNSVHYSCPRF